MVDKMKNVNKNVLFLCSILTAIPIVCIICFIIPLKIQDLLRVQSIEFNPLTFITSNFVHSNFSHLISNILAYIPVVVLLCYIYKESERLSLFIFSLISIVFILPFTYYLLLFFLQSRRFFHFDFVSCGLSLVVSGLVGFLIPSLSFFIRDNLKLKIEPSMIFLSIISLTGILIILPYFKLDFTYILIIIILLFLGSYVGKYELATIWKYIVNAKLKKDKLQSIVIICALTTYFVLVIFAFPSKITQPTGTIVNILAHYFGISFGLMIPYLFSILVS